MVPPPTLRATQVHNRIGAVMLHIPWYTFQGHARLAADAGVSRSAISRAIAGRSTPSYRVLAAIAAAFERRLQRPPGSRPLDARELVSVDGTYPTPSVCELVGCSGCLPDAAYDENDELKRAYYGLRPGQWQLSAPGVLTALKEGK